MKEADLRRAAFPLIPVPLNCNFVKKATRVALVEIYTSPLCGYCHRAMRLLRSKGAAFEEIDVGADDGVRAQMGARAGGRYTVPQIFIDGHHVGGCDDLHDFDAQGKLDPMLTGK